MAAKLEKKKKKKQVRSQHNPTEEEDEEGGPFKLDRKFAEKVHDPMLAPLLPVMRGLVRFSPSGYVTADEALCLSGDDGQWAE